MTDWSGAWPAMDQPELQTGQLGQRQLPWRIPWLSRLSGSAVLERSFKKSPLQRCTEFSTSFSAGSRLTSLRKQVPWVSQRYKESLSVLSLSRKANYWGFLQGPPKQPPQEDLVAFLHMLQLRVLSALWDWTLVHTLNLRANLAILHPSFTSNLAVTDVTDCVKQSDVFFCYHMGGSTNGGIPKSPIFSWDFTF